MQRSSQVEREFARIAALTKSAPIMCLPADIRAMIYESLAPIDQFKMNCCVALRRVFNPYKIYKLDTTSKDFSMLLYMYTECKLYDKVSPELYHEYIRSPQNLKNKLCGFNAYSDILYEKDDLHNYYQFMYHIFTEMRNSYISSSYDTYVVFFRFCLIKLDRDRHKKRDIRGNILGKDEYCDFWTYTANDADSSKSYMYTDVLTAGQLYHTIYKALIGQIIESDTVELYSILDEYFIESSSDIVRDMLYTVVNETYHILYTARISLDPDLYYSDTKSRNYKIQHAHLRYVTKLSILFDMLIECIINISEAIGQIVLLITSEDIYPEELAAIIKDRNIDTYYSSIWQNSIIAKFLDTSPASDEE